MESHPLLPVCITLDVSASMNSNGSLGAVNACLPDLQAMMFDEPLAAEMARVGLVVFNDQFEVALPLTDLAEIDMPMLSASGGTSYSAALRGTREFLEESLRSLGKGTPYYKPIVFFLTDGMPLDDPSLWRPEADALRAGKSSANVVCFGFSDANEDVLTQIGRTFLFRNLDPVAAVKEIFRSLVGSVRTTTQSLAAGGPQGLVLPNSILENADLIMEQELRSV